VKGSQRNFAAFVQIRVHVA